MNQFLRNTIMPIGLCCILASCHHGPMRIYPVNPYVYERLKSEVEDWGDNLPFRRGTCRIEYYVVENYDADTGHLHTFLNSFIDTTLGDKYKNYDEFIIYLYKTSQFTHRDMAYPIDDKQSYESYDDIIAEFRWWGGEKEPSIVNFFKDGRVLFDPNGETVTLEEIPPDSIKKYDSLSRSRLTDTTKNK